MATKLLRADNKNPVIGDDMTVPVSVSAVASGVSISKAWITFKTNKDSEDTAILQKSITSGFSGTSTVTFSFSLSNTDTAIFKDGTKYFFDVQVLDSNGKITTPIPDGEATFQKGVTKATA